MTVMDRVTKDLLKIARRLARPYVDYFASHEIVIKPPEEMTLECAMAWLDLRHMPDAKINQVRKAVDRNTTNDLAYVVLMGNSMRNLCVVLLMDAVARNGTDFYTVSISYDDFLYWVEDRHSEYLKKIVFDTWEGIKNANYHSETGEAEG